MAKQLLFLDEAGDTTFFGKHRCNAVGAPGVSKTFMLGGVSVEGDLAAMREAVRDLQAYVETSPLYCTIPSVEKKRKAGGFYFHATDDAPEVRALFIDFLPGQKVSANVIVARKDLHRFQVDHAEKETAFYVDLLARLLHDHLCGEDTLVLKISQRDKATHHSNLDQSLRLAINRQAEVSLVRKVVFDVQPQRSDPLLNVADYFCWPIQRFYERGEGRFMLALESRYQSVIDLYHPQAVGVGERRYFPGSLPGSTGNFSPLSL